MRRIFYILFIVLSIGLPLKKGIGHHFIEVLHPLSLGPLSNKQGVSQDPLLSEIVHHIQTKYGAKTIILFGSRARGEAKDHSDYDIIGLLSLTKESQFHQEFFKGAYLDISLIPQNFQATTMNEVPPYFWEEAIVLYQPHHEGEKFIDDIKSAFAKEEKKISLSLQEKQNKVQMLVINFNRAQKNEIREHLYRHRFLSQSLQIYFSLRDLPYKGVRKSLSYLKNYDSGTYEAFQKACVSNASTKELYELLLSIVGTDFAPEVINMAKNTALTDNQIKKTYIFSEDVLLPSIVSYIQKKYGVHTLILFGSRAQGAATPQSDYDLVAFREGDFKQEQIREIFKGAQIELSILSKESLNDVDLTYPIGLISGAAVLCQRDHLGDRFISHIKKIYKRGFITTHETKKLVADVIGMTLWKVNNDTLEGQIYHHFLLSMLIEDYFTFRNLHKLGTREDIKFLKEKDLPTYLAFEKALKPDANISSLKELVSYVSAPYEKEEQRRRKRVGS